MAENKAKVGLGSDRQNSVVSQPGKAQRRVVDGRFVFHHEKIG